MDAATPIVSRNDFRRGLAVTGGPAGIPLAPLTEWLMGRVPGFDGSAHPVARLLTGGRSNLTYALTDASGRTWVIRRPPLGHIMPSAHDLGREFTVLSGLVAAGFPVPHPWGLCEDTGVIGAQFLVMEFIDGVVVSDAQEAALLSPDSASRLSGLFIDALGQLHCVDATHVGLGQFGRPDGYLARQVTRWGQQWELSKTRRHAAVDELASWLSTQVPGLGDELPWSIVHGDYRVDNIIVDPTFSTLRAVLDWELSTLGDPIVDLAVALVYWTQADDVLRRWVPVAQDITSGSGFWTRSQLVNHYATETNRDLDHLGVCLVFACYKLAVIMQSLDYRSQQGHQLGRTTERGEDMAAAVDALASLGQRLIDAPEISTLSA